MFTYNKKNHLIQKLKNTLDSGNKEIKNLKKNLKEKDKRINLLNLENQKFIKKRKKSLLHVPKKKEKTTKSDYNKITKKLNEEIHILQKNHFIFQKEQESLCKNLISEISKILQERNLLEINVYGSFATGLAMPWSDIDLSITNKDDKNSPFYESNHILMKNMVQILQNRPDIIEDVNYVDQAHIPIIKITSSAKFNFKKIDITVKESDDKTHNGEKCVKLVKDYLFMYRELKPLFLVIKQLVFLAQLNDPYQGGVSSYTLILMLVSFLQMKKKNFNEDEEVNYGCYLIEFFTIYIKIKFAVLEVRPFLVDQEVSNLTIYQKVDIGTERVSQLSVIDPLDINNNVAKPSYNAHYLQYLFYFIYFNIFSESESVLQNIFENAVLYKYLK